MIHVRASSGVFKDLAAKCGISEESGCLHISLVGLPTIKQFSVLLNRSLNCAPEFEKDWFELSDKVDTFIAKEKSITKT